MATHCRQGRTKFVPYCSGCVQGAARKRSHWRLDPGSRVGGSLAVDLSGPHVEGRGYGHEHHGVGFRYFLAAVFQPSPVDGVAQVAWPFVRWLHGKTAMEVLRAIQSVVAEVEAMQGCRAVYRIHSDRGGEFVNDALSTWCSDRCITMSTTEGHDPAGNGQAESFVGRVKARARAMLAMSGLSTQFWTFAVEHAALCTRLKAQGRDLPAMPIFGQSVLARIKDTGAEQDDFKPKAVKGTFLGLARSIHEGKSILYENGLIDINSTIYVATEADKVEEVVAGMAPTAQTGRPTDRPGRSSGGGQGYRPGRRQLRG